MKPTIITAALAAMCTLSAAAEVLSPAQALARLESQPVVALRRARALSAPAPALTVNDSQGQPALYVMDNSLIVSADSEAAPLVGYADSQFDPTNVPPAMLEMLNVYADEIGALRAGSIASAPAAASADFAPIEPLCPTLWGQSAPYNALCPVSSAGTPCVTGCVATAIAQVLYTYRYPRQITSDISYNWGEQTLELKAADCIFSWEDMKPVYGLTDNADAVALLMKACGYAASMNYAQQVSGAVVGKLLAGLVNYFDYDRTARIEERSWYNLDDWQKMVYDELALGHAVYYGGSAPAGGAHAFVVDGYKSDGYFHINWGWDGQSNGYFLLSALNPSSQGIGGYAGGYNSSQMAIMGLRPGLNTPESEVEPVMEIVDGYNMADGTLGSTVAFSGGFRNPSLQLPMASTLRFEFASVNGGATYYATTNVPSMRYAYYSGKQNITVTLPANMAEGIYNVRPMTYVESTGKYYPTRISPTEILQCTVSGNKASFSKLTANVKAENVEVLSPLVPGFTFKARFTAVNSSAVPFGGTLKLRLQDAGGNILADEDGNEYMTTQSIYLESNSSLVVDIEQQGTTFKSAKAGTYYLVVCDNSGNPVSSPVEVEVLYGANPGALECTGVRVVSTSQTNVRVQLDLKCLPGQWGAGTYYAGPVQFSISGLGAPSDPVNSETVFIQMNETETAEIFFSVPFGTVGETYSISGKYFQDGGAHDMAGSTASFTLTADPEPEIPVVTVARLECTSLECTSALKGALEFKATVRNTGADYAGPLYITVYDNENTPEDAPFLTHEAVELKAGDEQEFTFTPSQMTWGTEGAAYHAEIAWKHPTTGEISAIPGEKNHAAFVMTNRTSIISEISADAPGALPLYDLQGRRVASPRRGCIYVAPGGRKLRL